ncbi:hypothetical protein BTN49_2034 [Candidatus Enterovibrio escicola]|uniref:Uncharacterized protein n=1 Tax=Candidatus Enterovibrio escicola TaxID=1927127 RepID=A0A2A5T2A5_9GAMM|nr:hypothetical protein BTN49_2034 [Candidatus Enterovibrio escacola]
MKNDKLTEVKSDNGYYKRSLAETAIVSLISSLLNRIGFFRMSDL